MRKSTKNYQSPNPLLWRGRNDGIRFHKVVNFIDFNKGDRTPQKGISLIGFAVDIGIKRNNGNLGASKGPDVIRQKLATLAYHGSQPIYDQGNIVAEGDDLETAQEKLKEVIRNNPVLAIVIGGGHELAWPQYKGLSEKYKKPIAIVNIDAHFDIRPLDKGKATSGTSFNQIEAYCRENKLPFNYFVYGIQEESNTDISFSKAKDIGVELITAEKIHMNSEETTRGLMNFVKKYEYVYLSVCMDAFSEVFAPGVSARSPLGLFPWQVLSVIGVIANSGRVVGLGVAEFSPNRDSNDITANLTSNLLSHFIRNYRQKRRLAFSHKNT